MAIKDFFSFRQNSYFWLNLLAMVAVVAGLIFGVLKGIDIYTRHGQAVVVPDVKGASLTDARRIFSDRGLVCVVSDSTYVKERPAGCILDYHPAAGQKVKEGRIVYLTVNTLQVPLYDVPDVADNSSVRQAEARLLAAGFKIAGIEQKAGEKDWVYDVKYNGRVLGMGEQVPVGASLVLVIGDGGELEKAEADSLRALQEEENRQPAAGSATEESWF